MEYELYHHGILGMKWGIRRYQNKDGSLTEAGRRRLTQRQSEIKKAIYKFKTSDNPEKQARAQKKIYRLLDKYAKLVNEISYNRMTDEQVVKALNEFKFDDSLPSLVTSKNVSSGKSYINNKGLGLFGLRPVTALVKQDAEYYENMGKVGQGLKNTIAGATATIGLISLIKKLKTAEKIADK